MSEEYLIRVENLKKHFPLKKGFFQTLLSKDELTVKAVDGISFGLRKEVKKKLTVRPRLKALGKVGDGSKCSIIGCGRLAKKSVSPQDISSSGAQTNSSNGYLCNVHFKEVEKNLYGWQNLKDLRRMMQIVFQDPFEIGRASCRERV